MKRFLLVVLVLACFSSILTCKAFKKSSTLSADIVEAYDETAIHNDIINYYGLGSKTNLSITYKSSSYTYLVNLNQSSLNAYYWIVTYNGISDSCHAVAIVDLIKHYKGTMDTDTAFVNLVNQAYASGYCSTLGMILGSKTKQSITLCASQNSVSGSGAEFLFNKRARTRNALNAGTPVLLALYSYSHSVVATGIEIYTVSYTEGGTTHSFDVEYFMVNEGLGVNGGSLILSQWFSDSTGAAYILQ